MTRRQTIAIGVLSSTVAAWLAVRFGVVVAIVIAAAAVIATSITFDRDEQREKRLERRSSALATYLQDEIETLYRAIGKMHPVGPSPPELKLQGDLSLPDIRPNA